MRDDERNPFLEDLAMVAVPAFIAVLPDLLHFVRKARKKKRKPAIPPAEGSFREYVLSQERE